MIIEGTTVVDNAVTNPNNVLTEDQQYATFDHIDDWIEVSGFSTNLPSIEQIKIILVGLRTTTGNSTVSVSYKLSGAPTGSTKNVKFTSPSVDTKEVDITLDRSWTPADISNLTIRIDGVSLGSNKSLDLDFYGIEAISFANNPLVQQGQDKRYLINSTSFKIVSAPSGNDFFDVVVQNFDQNTQYLYVSTDPNVSEDNGFKLLPAQIETWRIKSGTEMFAFFPDYPEYIQVSLHEVS